MNSNFGAEFKVRELLGDKNLAEIARRLGVSRCLPAMWRRGECFPNDENRAQLARYFGIPDPSLIVPEEGEAA